MNWKIGLIFALILLFPAHKIYAQANSDKPLLVFAAASLKDALEEISNQYEANFKKLVIVSFASSSALARQLEHGAPADVYISADVEWMDYLAEKEIIHEESRKKIAANSLVLVGKNGESKSLDLMQPDAFDRLLGENRLAMADPSHVPAGRYGKAALESLEIWNRISNRIIPVENVRVALTLVSRGEVTFGIVYASDAKVDRNVKVLVEIPVASHPPVQYPAAVVKTSTNQSAGRFIEFLSSSDSQLIFKKYGFGPVK